MPNFVLNWILDHFSAAAVEPRDVEAAPLRWGDDPSFERRRLSFERRRPFCKDATSLWLRKSRRHLEWRRFLSEGRRPSNWGVTLLYRVGASVPCNAYDFDYFWFNWNWLVNRAIERHNRIFEIFQNEFNFRKSIISLIIDLNSINDIKILKLPCVKKSQTKRLNCALNGINFESLKT